MLFILLLFKLKKLQIYMEPKNVTVEKVNDSIARLYRLAVIYFVWYVTVLALDLSIEFDFIPSMSANSW